MDHEYIKNFDCVDRYIMGKLLPEEREQFEEHFLDCDECLENLRTSRDFQQGLRLLSIEGGLPGQSVSPSQMPQTPPISRQKILAVAACAIIAFLAVISLLLFNRIGQLQGEVVQAQNDQSVLQQRYEEDQQANAAIIQNQEKNARDLKEQVQQMETQVQEAQKRKGDASASWALPGINIPIYPLSPVPRGAPANEALPVKEKPLYIVSLSLEGVSKNLTYRVTVFTSQRRIWGTTGLKPDRYNTLNMIFRSDFFPPGEYEFRVDEASNFSGSGDIGIYSVRVLK